jgi:hypothetical protein
MATDASADKEVPCRGYGAERLEGALARKTFIPPGAPG